MWSHKWSTLQSLSTHTDNLGKLVGAQNVIVYGPEGNGMMSVVHRMLDETGIIPWDHEWSFTDCRLNTDNKNTIGILTRRNNKCVEIIMRNFGTNERYIVKNVIQKISENFFISEKGLVYKNIIIHNIEHFSNESQKIIAVFAEKHSNCTRYFFTTNKYSSVSPSLLTQCAAYRIGLPEKEELPHDRHLENSRDHAQMRSLGIESSIKQCFDDILAKLNNIKVVRDIVYTMLVNNVPGNKIIAELTDRCVCAFPTVAHQVIHWAAEYDHRLSKCERPMYHIEAFFVRLSFLITSNKNASSNKNSSCEKSDRSL